jgi:lysophospholipase L1-like esterase
VAVVALLAGCESPMKPTPGVPTIACPANVTVRGVAGGTQPVTYSAPVVTGGAAPVNVTCTPGSGAPFTVGTTAVACNATDAQSHQAQCSFTVTLTALLLSVTKFVAFGDSFTEGQNGRPGLVGERFVDLPNAYPTKLQFMLNIEYPGQGIVVSNQGLGGEPVDRGRLRLPGVLAQEQGGALLLLDGYNDLSNSCKPLDANSAQCANTINDVVAGLRKMIQIGKVPSYGIKYIFVSTLTPPGSYLGGDDRRIAGQAIVQTNAKLIPMIRSEGALVVDPYPAFVGHEAAYVDQDGLHLRPAGYQVLAETFFVAIKNTVTSTPGFGAIH